MKKYLLTALLLLTIILTLIACGSEEPTVDTTNNNTTNENVVGTENADDIDAAQGRNKAIEDDYLKAADKTELNNAINGKVAQSA